MDAISLVGQNLAEMTLELRLYFLRSYLTKELETVSKDNRISLQLLPNCLGTKEEINKKITTDLGFKISHLLLVDKDSEYMVNGINYDAFITKVDKAAITYGANFQIFMRYNQFHKKYYSDDHKLAINQSPNMNELDMKNEGVYQLVINSFDKEGEIDDFEAILLSNQQRKPHSISHIK